jgi:two-component system NtrC family sensor kinase
VNVSTTVLKEQLNKNRSAGVNRIVGLLRENGAELGPFLTAHPKGKLIPEFLGSLATQMEGDRQRLLGEVEQLGKNIEHIKEIVAMQQSYARVAGMTEDLPVKLLIDDALRIQEGGFARQGINVRCNYCEVPAVRVDKHKVMQILLNLFRNAKYAMDATGRTDKVLTINTSWNGNGKVRIDVMDNGVGITAENLTRIFQHGFTTKKEGHGFGLHSGANAAREMGGTLYAASAGPSKGATFSLELPAAEASKHS